MILPDRQTGENSILNKLTIVSGWSHIGVGEKDVTKMTDGLNSYAHKVYTCRRLRSPDERSWRAQLEWNSLLQLCQSEFRDHVTKPVELLYENGDPVGLLTLWREGTTVELNGSTRIPSDSINRLAKDIQVLTKQGWYIESDDLREIRWDGKDLWFPECRLFNQSTAFPSHMAQASERLRWYPGIYTVKIQYLREC